MSHQPTNPTKKRVRIKLDDGRIFSVSGHDIAHNRASYYAEKDPDTTYNEEYEFTSNDSFEMTDWLFNNMNWWEMNPREERSAPKKLTEAEILETEVYEEKS